MIHPGLYNLICADGRLLRCYGRSRHPRIIRLAHVRRGVKLPVHDNQGLLYSTFWGLFRL